MIIFDIIEDMANDLDIWKYVGKGLVISIILEIIQYLIY